MNHPRHSTTSRLGARLRLAAVVLLALGVAAVPMAATTATASPARPAAAAPVTAAVTATTVRRVTLLTRSGHLRKRYTVTSSGRGHCWTTSMVNGRLYRCFRGNDIHDPCWKEQGRRSVVCLAAPWRTHVARIRLTRRLPRTDSYGPALWGLRVGDRIGVRCTQTQGASGSVGGKRISFYCQRGWVLLGGPDRSAPLWTIATARWVGGHYERRGRHHLPVAWRAVVH
jgi:hypothetical protein